MTLAGPRRDTRWWGWGDPGHRAGLGELGRRLLQEEIGAGEIDRPAPSRPELAEVRLPPARSIPDAVRRAAGADAVFEGHEDRLRHAAGLSYPDLIRLRSGELVEAPDAVLLPADPTAVAALLEACSRDRVAVVPFGGGTSVVGGVAPAREELEAVVALDLVRLRDVAVDRHSLTARLGPGLRGPEAEAALAARGLTTGHFPQSFAYATIGGFAATRSAGQASSGQGRFDELVGSLALCTPAGELRTGATPHTAAGPSLRELALGSEGALGVITEVTVRVRPRPEARRYEGWIAADFREGAEAVRELAQHDALPDVVRLSDHDETRLAMALSGSGGARPGGGGARTRGIATSALKGYLRLRGRSGGCALIVGWEGERESVERRRSLAARILRGAGAASVGRAPGRGWERGRFEGPYLRDALLDLGVMVETIETAHSWTRLEELYRSVRGALRSSLEAQGTPPIVLCHVSHAYPDGASLYFTFLARQRPGEEIEQWRLAKVAASEAIVAAGGTITHHHAVGRDHAPYMRAEVGEVGLEALRAVKDRLDPAGVMNPGKLLPA